MYNLRMFPQDMLDEFRPEKVEKTTLVQPLEQVERHLLCEGLLALVSPTERRVIEAVFFENMPVEGIATELGIFVEGIANMMADAFAKMRAPKTHGVISKPNGPVVRPPRFVN